MECRSIWVVTTLGRCRQTQQSSALLWFGKMCVGRTKADPLATVLITGFLCRSRCGCTSGLLYALFSNQDDRCLLGKGANRLYSGPSAFICSFLAPTRLTYAYHILYSIGDGLFPVGPLRSAAVCPQAHPHLNVFAPVPLAVWVCEGLLYVPLFSNQDDR